MLLQYFGKDLGIVPTEESDKPSKNLRRALLRTSHGYSFGIGPERVSKAAAGLRCARRQIDNVELHDDDQNIYRPLTGQ